MSIEEERKAFEDSMRKLAKNDEIKTDLNPKTGQYLYGVMEVMWGVWQASANREGYKLVPVETLECAMGWFGVVENEWTGAADLSDDFKHVDIIQKIIGSCDE